MKCPVLLVAVAILTGCAAVADDPCRSAYDSGFRDGIFGLQRQDDIYLAQCRRGGVPLDVARYTEGWQEGKYEFDRRKTHGGVD